MKQKFTFLLMLLMVCMGVSAQDSKTVKFYLGVTGYAPTTNDPVTVDATVYDDYSFTVQLPQKGSDVLGANKATIDIRMQNVASLGVTEQRSISKTIETGLENQASLSDWLKYTYKFNGASVPVTIKDSEGYKDFTYAIDGITDDNKIIGTPSSTEDARAAWMKLTSHVEAATSLKDDSYFGFKKGTYVQLGKERLTFDKDYNALEGDWDIPGVVDGVKDAASLNTNVDGSKDTDAYLYLPAGTTLQLGTSYATLKDDCKITINANSGSFTGMLSKMQSATSSTYNMVLTAVNMFDQVVYAVDAATSVPVTVEFTPSSTLTVYEGNSTAINYVSTDEWAGIQAEYPNAIAIAETGLADWAETQTNVVVKYAAGKNGTYYECPELVLADGKDYYSPVDFTAVSGQYYRKFNDQTSSCCLPFEISVSDFDNSPELLTFAYYEREKLDGNSEVSEWVWFNKRQTIGAGIPCLVNNQSSAPAFTKTFDNTEIVGSPENSTSMQGAFAKTDAYKSSEYYSMSTTRTQLASMESASLGAFRSVVCLHHDVELADGANNPNNGSSSSAKVLNIGVIDEWGDATAIDGTPVAAPAKSAIYTINGVKVNEAKTPGLYIINGKKTFIK